MNFAYADLYNGIGAKILSTAISAPFSPHVQILVTGHTEGCFCFRDVASDRS
ncbi:MULTISPECIES: hypothetical protein [unclassified Anabaena]|uniref:hypothetical protein n=1 Tax=unclassified Anabaena TaxID=2619674 RepID=UPI0039C74D13